MKFYGDDSATKAEPVTIGPTYGSGSSARSAPAAPNDAGKGSLDVGDPLGSIGHSLGSFKDSITGLIGGIGIPGGPNLGDVAELPGGAVDAIGGITLPYWGSDPNRGPAKLGDVPGVIGGVLGAAEQAVQGGVAGDRLRAAQEGATSGIADALAFVGRQAFGSHTDMLQGRVDDLTRQGQPIPADLAAALAEERAKDNNGLTPEFQARLDAGENVNVLAADMARRGIGYNNDPGANLAASIVLDPLNLLSFGAGKALTAGKAADRALRAGDAIGVGQRFMGKAYGAAARGLNAGGQALMDHTLGPVTSGVFHALGSRPYISIRSGLSNLAPQYGQAFEDALAVGAGQLPRAVIARQMADDVAGAVRRKGQAALSGLADAGDNLEARVSAMRTLNAAELERGSEELLLRVAPDFPGRNAASIADETVRKLASITGTSVEDAARVLGSKAGDIQTARTVHLAFYGKAIADFGEARALIGTAKNIDVQRLTIVAPDTLTAERAVDVLANGPQALIDAVERYSVLGNRFAGKAFDHAEVKAFIRKLQDEGALTEAVRAAKTGKNALPSALGDWRAKYGDLGYDLGFMPKDGIKTVVDDAGDVIYAEPFVGVTSEVDPLTIRNPLGRFTDSLFRGVTQTSIVLDSRARFVKATRDAGISIGEARGLHHLVLEEARRQGTTPRGLDDYAELFERFLGPERYAALSAKHDPGFLVMSAFEGNLSRVGLTQKITGKAKTASSERSNIVAQVAERIYPTVKFRLSPLFQLQELVESKVWNALRGILPRPASPEIGKLYAELSQLPEVRHFTEAGHFLHLWGSEAITRAMGGDTLLGRALQRVPNVAASKGRAQAAQIISEHGAAFEDAVNTINPKFWKAMTEAYGTTDARAVSQAFMAERFDLIDPAAALRRFDGIMPKTFASADEETVWQAFRESLRATSQQAFKTHYFDARRGWLERSINHPYLGLYPASYMWGKVLPEFARFLLVRPFGLNAPLLGARAYQRVQEAVTARLAGDPDFAKAVDDNPDLLYAFATLMPAMPNDLPANLPAWARHLSNDVTSGKPIDPQTFLTREATDAAAYAFGPSRSLGVAAGALGDLGDLGTDLMTNLTRAAEQLDAQFPRR